MKQLGFEVRLEMEPDEAIERVTEALKEEGFGVLTRIDVKATLKEKIGEDFRPYVILGACNPTLAHRALASEPRAGLMLPCNVTVEADRAGGSAVRIVDPSVMLTVGNLDVDPILHEVSEEARQKLERVAESLERPPVHG